MSLRESRLTTALVAGSLLATGAALSANEPRPEVEDGWFRAWPPASVNYTFPAAVHADGARIGQLDTVEYRATYLASVKPSAHFHWLLGADWQRLEAGVPAGAPLPDTVQSAAAVIGFDWFFRDGWRARLEVLPGVYSDFRDASGDDLNAPFNVEVSYAIGPRLLIGGQLNVNARRESPVLGAVGVRWRFAEDWLLSLWFPRPRLEYFATEHVTLFAGAHLVGGTFVVAEDFGQRHGRAALDGQPVDFQEVRVGGGIRFTIQSRFALEIGGGWTLDRRYDFHERNLELESGNAPYVQLGLGLQF